MTDEAERVAAFMKAQGFTQDGTANGYWYRPDFGLLRQSHAIFAYRLTLEARKDERENMRFLKSDGTETHIPFTEYRYTGDGLLLDWEKRTAKLDRLLGVKG